LYITLDDSLNIIRWYTHTRICCRICWSLHGWSAVWMCNLCPMFQR